MCAQNLSRGVVVAVVVVVVVVVIRQIYGFPYLVQALRLGVLTLTLEVLLHHPCPFLHGQVIVHN